MSNYNTILIKRRTSGSAGAPGSLSGGELAFNEVDSTLYYGSNAGVISVAGSGAYVDRTTSQTIGGDKTFTGLTTLSSTTFSLNSVIDLGANLITNVLDPLNDQDAATKKYVDDLGTTGNTAVNTLSTEVYNTFVKLTDDRAVTLTGGLDVTSGLDADTITTTGNAEIGGNLTVTGDFTVLGEFSQLETTTTVTSAFSITNSGSQTALTVEQTGSFDIAEFIDDGATALIIKNGGNVGIGTDSPNEKLTVVGSISATEDIFARNGDFTGTLDVNSTTTLNGAVTVNSSLTVVADLSGTENTSYLVNFIIDGGVF